MRDSNPVLPFEAATEAIHPHADVNRVDYDNAAPLDIARRAGADDVAEWLLWAGAKSAAGRESPA